MPGAAPPAGGGAGLRGGWWGGAPECPTLMSPLVDVVPLQLFAMDMAEIKGYDVDKPRNLAKSVTVE